MSKKKKESRILKSKYLWITVAVFFFIACINLYLERHPQYIYSYINCGMKQPIAVRNWGPSDIEYMEPGDKNYPSPNMFISYVCTEKEALELGAKHVPSGDRSDYYEY